MKKIAFLLLLTFLNTCLLANTIIQGRVIKVSDGDTITLLDKNNKQFKIRLYGIDCPEKGQDYYQVAKQYVSDAIYDEDIEVEVTNKDRYQRLIGIIRTANNVNLNLALLSNGLAWHYKQYDKSEEYAKAEESAKISKINIWSQSHSMAPWDFRKSKKKRKNHL